MAVELKAATYAAARARTDYVAGQMVFVEGRAAAGDGGEGLFQVVPVGDYEDDGGTVLVAGSVALVRVMERYLDVAWFGAAGFVSSAAGAADDAAAINAAAIVAATTAKTLFSNRKHRIEARVTIRGNCELSESEIHVYAEIPVAIEVSSGNAITPTTYLSDCTIVLPGRVINAMNTTLGWPYDGTGVRCVNLLSCRVYIGNVVQFATGVHVTSNDTKGNAYNAYHIKHLENNGVNIRLSPLDANSWVNENTFYDGRLSHYSNEGTNVPGTRHILLAKAASPINNNLFIRQSIEGNTAEYHVENGGSYNTFLSSRWEANPPRVLYSADNANQGIRNIIIAGYAPQSIVFTVDGTSPRRNRLITPSTEYIEGDPGAITVCTAGSAANDAIRVLTPEAAFAGSNGSNYSIAFSANSSRFKTAADAHPKIQFNHSTGLIAFGNGLSAPVDAVGTFGTSFSVRRTVWPGADNTLDIGQPTFRFANVYATQVRPGAGAVIWTAGAGTPEGAVAAPVGSMYTRTDGGAGTTLYVKETGTGNTGWTAK